MMQARRTERFAGSHCILLGYRIPDVRRAWHCNFHRLGLDFLLELAADLYEQFYSRASMLLLLAINPERRRKLKL